MSINMYNERDEKTGAVCPHFQFYAFATDLPVDFRSAKASPKRSMMPFSPTRSHVRGSYSFLYGLPDSGSIWCENALALALTKSPTELAKANWVSVSIFILKTP